MFSQSELANDAVALEHTIHHDIVDIEDLDEFLADDPDDCVHTHHQSFLPLQYVPCCHQPNARKGFGRIVNISSINGQIGQIGQTNYSASKAGIIGFTKALARESASKGITVNAVAPGYADTAMVKSIPENIMKSLLAQIPVGRLMQPEEIARMVAFLVTDESGAIAGETLAVNGGQYMEG